MSLSSISQLSKQCSAHITQLPSSHPYLYKTAYHGLCLATAIYFGQSLMGRAALLGATYAAGYLSKKALSALFPSPTQNRLISIESAPLMQATPVPLHFTGVELGDEQLQDFKNPALTLLSITECSFISDQIVEKIISLIKSDRLTNLTLAYSQLSDSQVQALAQALSVNHSLQDCRLSFCIPSEEGVTLIAKSLVSHQTIHTLHLESNSIVGPAMTALAELIKTNRAIKNLVFAYQMFQDPGSKKLAEALLENDRLKSLDLSKNAMTPEAYDLFKQWIVKRPSLQISLPNSPISFSFI